jgi:cytochrome P450
MGLDSLRAELTTLLLAGADTIATAACSAIIHILQSPMALAKLLCEHKGARDLGLLSPIPQQAEVLEHCPYYVACVKESMRICPSVQSIFPREVMPDQALVLEGKVIPPGTEVACNPWIIHRDRKIYGADADVWRPERWLENNGEAGKVLEKYNLALGYGSRICLGRDLGMMQLLKFPLMVSFGWFA